jgi:hypothetical protein
MHWQLIFAATILAGASSPLAAQTSVAPKPASALARTATPRTPDGKPDFSGMWEGPFIQDMSKDGLNKDVRNQKGAGVIPLTDWGKEKMATQVDVSVHCLPTGYVRTTNAPFPMEIMQRPGRIVILYEINNNFHLIFTDGRGHPQDLEPTWAGHSIGAFAGDTLVVDTIGFNGKTQLDTEGHPHSDQLHVVERFSYIDPTHLNYDLTIEDPKAYTRPWKNVRTFTLNPTYELLEYSCNENNKDFTEGHIK